MFELKTISRNAVQEALVKAERYRLLNEPREAESICRDILEVDSGHQKGLVVLLLALTDQFGAGFEVSLYDARALLPRLKDEYERAYYQGVIAERWGKAQVQRGVPSRIGHDWLREAMTWYEKAEAIHPEGNDEAILRWNTCARIINQGSSGEPQTGTAKSATPDPGFDDEVPVI